MKRPTAPTISASRIVSGHAMKPACRGRLLGGSSPSDDDVPEESGLLEWRSTVADESNLHVGLRLADLIQESRSAYSDYEYSD